MIDIATLNEQIIEIKEWLTKAGKSLMSFYNEEYGVFWRDTIEDMRKQDLHPTSTNRSFYALYEYLRFLHEEDLVEMKDQADDITFILKGVAEKYLAKLLSNDPEERNKVRKSNQNDINMFTDSHLLISVSLLEGLQRVPQKINVDIPKIRSVVEEEIAQQRKTELLDQEGGKVREEDEVHDFVTLSIMRGVDVFFRSAGGLSAQETSRLRDRAQEDILRLLAFHYAGVSSRFDATELVFSTVLLNRLTSNASQLTEGALLTIKEAQGPDGGWPTARLISYAGSGLLHVASYEVALALTHLLNHKLYNNDLSFCDLLLPTLSNAFKLIKSHYSEGAYINGWRGNPITGWANDHIHRHDLIESWSTAIVLLFLIHYRDALYLLRQQLVLKQYNTTLTTSDGFKPLRTWPDMIPAFRLSESVNLDHFVNSVADPSDNIGIAKGLKTDVLHPILNNWIQRPSKGKASLIFYGPPGTRKTTLSSQIAKALQWPLLTLSPPDFLKNGLEGFEACAAEIFNNLLHLRRVVVLLDECEDFFKARPKDQRIEIRTTGAFITAGMLPRLQKLHDQHWIIFILATNSELDDLDEAVRRQGRFDYAQEIGYPTEEAQKRYISKQRELSPNKVPAVQEALKIEHLAAVPNAPYISFALLDRLVEKITTMEEPKPIDILAVLKQLLKQKGPPPLISTSEPEMIEKNEIAEQVDHLENSSLKIDI